VPLTALPNVPESEHRVVQPASFVVETVRVPPDGAALVSWTLLSIVKVKICPPSPETVNIAGWVTDDGRAMAPVPVTVSTPALLRVAAPDPDNGRTMVPNCMPWFAVTRIGRMIVPVKAPVVLSDVPAKAPSGAQNTRAMLAALA